MKFTDIGTIGQSTSLHLGDLAVLKYDLTHFECVTSVKTNNRMEYLHRKCNYRQ